MNAKTRTIGADLACIGGAVLLMVACSSSPNRSGDGGAAGTGGASASGTGGAGAGGSSATVCGFVMPNPVPSGLPNPAAYDTNVAGIVTDRVTGLAWERAVDATATYGYLDAVAHCRSVTLGGHSDWRLPSVLELTSLLDYTRASPSIDPVAFPSTPSDFYWTSTTWGGSTSITRVVDFDASGSSSKDNGDTYHVRCVRTAGTPAPRCAPPASRYQAASGLVTDALTGLIWQQNAPTSAVTWDAGRTQCTNLGTGFRLPSLGELQTILDYNATLNDPQIDLTAFPGAPPAGFWTSSAAVGAADNVWTVSFGSGVTGLSPVTYVSNVRCVR
jgi:hypothetical protein